MDRAAGFAVISCLLLAVILISGIFQMDFFRPAGYELFRSYQLFLSARETSRWQTLDGEHFTIRYRDGDEKAARMVLKEAERVYGPLGKYFNYYPAKKVPVSIYHDRASLNRVFGWESSQSAMGVYWGGVIRILDPKEWLGDLTDEEVEVAFRAQGPVAHEYIHLIVDYKTRGNYPRWLTEGLAQYGEEHFAGVIPVGGRQELTPLSCSIKELEKNFDDPAWQDYSYAVAKGFTTFLIQEYGADRINRLLDNLGRGYNVDRAFAETYGISFSEFVDKYNKYNDNNHKSTL